MTRDRRTPARRWASLLAGFTAFVVLAGCSQFTQDTGSRATSSTDGSTSVQSTAAPETRPEFAPLDQKLLIADRATFTHGQLSVTNLLVNHEMPGLAYSLDIVRGQIVRQHHWGGGGSLTVTPTLVASSSKALAVTLTATTGQDTSTAVVYHDPQTNHSFASTALIAPARWAEFTGAVAAKVGDNASRASEQLAEPTFPNGTGPAIGFSANGDLVVVFQPVDGSTIAPVAIKGEPVAGLLTEFGVRARAAAQYPTPATSPAEFARFDPALVGAAPTASTSPSATTAATTPAGSPTSSPASSPALTPDPRPQLGLGTDCSVKKCVALTFDDGPVPQTGEVLDRLNELKVPATFFVLGTSVDVYPKVLAQTAANGMEIASHNQVHNQMSRTGHGLLDKQVHMAATNIRAVTGQDPLFLRPPYGARNKASDRTVGKYGMAVALWSVDTLDWKYSKTSPAAAEAGILSTVSEQIGNGGVVLMHDLHANSRAATTAVVQKLQSQGYTLVTLAELAPADYSFGKSFCRSPLLERSCGS